MGGECIIEKKIEWLHPGNDEESKNSIKKGGTGSFNPFTSEDEDIIEEYFAVDDKKIEKNVEKEELTESKGGQESKKKISSDIEEFGDSDNEGKKDEKKKLSDSKSGSKSKSKNPELSEWTIIE